MTGGRVKAQPEGHELNGFAGDLGGEDLRDVAGPLLLVLLMTLMLVNVYTTGRKAVAK